MNGTTRIDLSFPHNWRAQILATRPLILPTRHFTYPREAEEVERGALEILIHPFPVQPQSQGAPGPEFGTWESTTPDQPPFLATCALGFRDAAVPSGIWSTPNPEELCAISGGYAYIIRTDTPGQFTMLPYRPVLDVRAAPLEKLLLFIGHRSILAWGHAGQAWESEKLSDEGLTIDSLDNGILRGTGWRMITDKEVPFSLELRTGKTSD